MDFQQTKIIASLGPATDNEAVLKDMILSGLDCARINCSHQDRDEIISRSKDLRRLSIDLNRPVALLVDLQGPKIRLGSNVMPRELALKEKVVFSNQDQRGIVKVELDNLSRLATKKSEIIIGDGLPRLQVKEINKNQVVAEVTQPGRISAAKGFSLTKTKNAKSGLTKKDLSDLKTAIEVGADFIAVSFVKSPRDIKEVKDFLKKHKSRARVIAKIEKLEALENIEAIVAEADGVLIARGDFGVEAGFSEVPFMQKKVIQVAREAGVLVITATQMLESMINSPLPTRAEASDVANAVLEGTSAVMLSAETAVGKYPAKVIKTMSEIISRTEKHRQLELVKPSEEKTAHDLIMSSATTLAQETNAKAIVVLTESGKSARAAARYQPLEPIIALTPYQRVADQLAVERGVYGFKFQQEESTRAMIKKLDPFIKEVLSLKKGSYVLVRGDSKKPHTIRLVDF